MIYTGSVIDFLEVNRRLSEKLERDKETETKLRYVKAVTRHNIQEPATS